MKYTITILFVFYFSIVNSQLSFTDITIQLSNNSLIAATTILNSTTDLIYNPQLTYYLSSDLIISNDDVYFNVPITPFYDTFTSVIKRGAQIKHKQYLICVFDTQEQFNTLTLIVNLKDKIINKINAYSITGTFIASVNDISELDTGHYILQHISNNKIYKTQQIYKKY